MDHLRDKVATLNSQLHRLQESLDLEGARVRHSEDDKCSLETRLHDTEAKLSSCEAIRDSLRRDKSIVRVCRCKIIVVVDLESVATSSRIPTSFVRLVEERDSHNSKD